MILVWWMPLTQLSGLCLEQTSTAAFPKNKSSLLQNIPLSNLHLPWEVGHGMEGECCQNRRDERSWSWTSGPQIQHGLVLSKESIARDCLWGLSLKVRCSQRKWVSWLLGGYASFYLPLTSPCSLLPSLESSFCKNTSVKMCPAVPQATLWNAIEP